MHCVRTEHRVFNVWLAGSCLYVKLTIFIWALLFSVYIFPILAGNRKSSRPLVNERMRKTKFTYWFSPPHYKPKIMINVSQDSGQLLLYLPSPPLTAQTWAVWAVKLTTVLFIYFFKFVCDFHPTAEIFFALCCKVNMMKMILFNKFRCGWKCQVCLFILIENVLFCLHIKKKNVTINRV